MGVPCVSGGFSFRAEMEGLGRGDLRVDWLVFGSR